MNKLEIKNWKLKEILKEIEILSYEATDYLEYVLKKRNVPLSDFKGIDRAQTQINWSEMKEYYKFNFDGVGEEKQVENALNKSELSTKDKLIIIYGYKEPAVLISTDTFIEDWEDFFASVHYETIMFSEDFELILEVSRDYNLHSNFKIR